LSNPTFWSIARNSVRAACERWACGRPLLHELINKREGDEERTHDESLSRDGRNDALLDREHLDVVTREPASLPDLLLAALTVQLDYLTIPPPTLVASQTPHHATGVEREARLDLLRRAGGSRGEERGRVEAVKGAD
jgi:hypothetical protein